MMVNKKFLKVAAFILTLSFLVAVPLADLDAAAAGIRMKGLLNTVADYSFDLEGAAVGPEGIEPRKGVGFLLLSAAVMKLFITLVGVLFVIQIVIAGITWMTAQGNEEKVKSARKKMNAAIIGFMIMLTAYIVTWTVTRVLATIFNYQFLTFS